MEAGKGALKELTRGTASFTDNTAQEFFGGANHFLGAPKKKVSQMSLECVKRFCHIVHDEGRGPLVDSIDIPKTLSAPCFSSVISRLTNTHMVHDER